MQQLAIGIHRFGLTAGQMTWCGSGLALGGRSHVASQVREATGGALAGWVGVRIALLELCS